MNTANGINQSGSKLLLKAIARIAFAFVFMVTLIFVPAGTIRFINGWLFIAGLMVPMIFTFIFLYNKDPELLEKRMNAREKEDVQKKYIILSFPLVIIAYLTAGFDFRFQWSDVPMWLVVISLFIMIGGYAMFVVVLMQNRYASRTIEIQHEQKVIETGLYSVVRHPMYLAVSMLYLSSVLVLCSYFALIPMFLLTISLVIRINNEEKVLIKGLPGYDNYMKKVKYRMIPFIW